MNNKLSISIPTYNEEKHISETIESIINQTFTDFELLIVDNCSTDNTLNIVQNFAKSDSRIKIHKNKNNIGMYKNFTLSFNITNSEYFMWAGAHDILSPTYLEDIFIKIKNSKIDPNLVFTDVMHIDEHGDILKDYHSVGFEIVKNNISNYLRRPWNFTGSGDMVYGVFKSISLKKTGIFDNVMWPDVLLINEIFFTGKIIKIHSPLRHRRFHRESYEIIFEKWKYKYIQSTNRLRSRAKERITWDLYLPNLIMVFRIFFNIGIKNNYLNPFKFILAIYFAFAFLCKHWRAALIDLEILFKR